MKQALALSLSALAASLSFANSDTAYLLTSFRDNGDGLHLAYSYDARDWTDLDQVYLEPTVGSKLMRDPHILRTDDGTYHMVWTSGWSDLGIGYATSENLTDWSEQKYLPLMEDVEGANQCWAPEIYYDKKKKSFVIVWSTSVTDKRTGETNFRAYYSLTKNFETLSKPKILFDPGFDNIDTTILKQDDAFYAIFKETDDQGAKDYGSIYAAKAKKITGPYEVLDHVILKKEQAEGPTVVDTEDGVYVYFDYYTDHRYGARVSTDWETWKKPTDDIAFPEGQRHGSIFRAPESLVASLIREAASVAPAPALQGEFTADPAIRAFGDRYYIYPTSDRPYWNTKEFAVWSSPDLVEWKKENVFLDLREDISWANNKAWAPDCIERNGKYYFYFCGEHNIGVAVGDSPTGPFEDALDRPLIDNETIKTFSIDPYAFIDDDGQAYLYFGNGTPTVYRLNDDMISFDGEHVEFPLRDFREGIVVFKRNGKYYFMWSIDDARSPDYRVGWGVSDSPYGPVVSPDAEEDFIVLRQNGPAQGTAHHSIVNVPGTDRWYVAYHRHAVPGGGGYKRETCIVRMEFDDQGNILPMDPMQPAFEKGDVGEPITLAK
ncbi:family 43 glycosylhydrolase [Pelagicoccus sp. SDUM812003]|uniref:family 43 glycosylhydrolase n=1 Tax=Pelagicoccus sp. SDUM812003 TaxID=3041267 RepID=UPI00280CEC37|nr:family 43 glycosylhydrolase [Pelagicoccus sp. SDUM812003]MDQ8205673.1 family 43 glycosylhydrolase [Pelagicoccus sp. SDUM812003]